jgi:hypothetical protein
MVTEGQASIPKVPPSNLDWFWLHSITVRLCTHKDPPLSQARSIKLGIYNII